jgi:hypothetical protein
MNTELLDDVTLTSDYSLLPDALNVTYGMRYGGRSAQPALTQEASAGGRFAAARQGRCSQGNLPLGAATGQACGSAAVPKSLCKLYHTAARAFPPRDPLGRPQVPAFFADRRLGVLVLYEGAKPWTDGALRFTMPGARNDYFRPTERWG